MKLSKNGKPLGRPNGSKTVIKNTSYVFTDIKDNLVQYQVIYTGGHYHKKVINHGIASPVQRMKIKQLLPFLESNCGENFISIFIKVFGVSPITVGYLRRKGVEIEVYL